MKPTFRKNNIQNKQVGDTENIEEDYTYSESGCIGHVSKTKNKTKNDHKIRLRMITRLRMIIKDYLRMIIKESSTAVFIHIQNTLLTSLITFDCCIVPANNIVYEHINLNYVILSHIHLIKKTQILAFSKPASVFH